MTAPDPRAVLVTGVYGSGKSSVAEEIVDLLEHRGVSYALLDLDFLGWYHTGDADEPDRMRLANVRAVVSNYLAGGVRSLVLAGTVRDQAELDTLRAELAMPVQVVRLTVPLDEIEKRLRSHPTTARVRDDLPEAAAQIAASACEGVEDLVVANDRPVRDVATEIVTWLGW